MAEEDIIKEIERILKGCCFIWTIGITDNPTRKKKEHRDESRDVSYWHHWETISEIAARRIQKFFLDKGCKNGSEQNGSENGRNEAKYIYIF